MKKKTVQNEQSAVEAIKPVVDQVVVDTVHEIFEAVIRLNSLGDIFEDLAERIINDLKANSLLEYSLELSDEQKKHLKQYVGARGFETVDHYLANLDMNLRTKEAYGLVREKTTEIADAVLSSIGQEINRGAIIDARAVQANSKNKDYDEILLRKSKTSGDITIPTSCILISTNCVEVIKASCQADIDAVENTVEDAEEND
jgi:hypothetical protein